MSKVIVARSAGFCFGVSRSVKMAEELLKQRLLPEPMGRSFTTKTWCAQPLGARTDRHQSSPEEVRPGDRVIIRSHGVSGRGVRTLSAPPAPR